MTRPAFTQASENGRERAVRAGTVSTIDGNATLASGSGFTSIVSLSAADVDGKGVIETITTDVRTGGFDNQNLSLVVSVGDSSKSLSNRRMRVFTDASQSLDLDQPIDLRDGEVIEVYGAQASGSDVDAYASVIYRGVSF